MKKNKKRYKVVVAVVISFLALITVFDIWWNIPVSFLKRVEASDIAYIEVQDEETGKQFTVQDREDIAYIVGNLKGRDLRRDGISLGYTGTWFTLSFYDTEKRCVEELIINYYNTVRRDPFFYLDVNEGLCLDYLCMLEAELAGAWEEQ